jgi:hypothetical protein
VCCSASQKSQKKLNLVFPLLSFLHIHVLLFVAENVVLSTQYLFGNSLFYIVENILQQFALWHYYSLLQLPKSHVIRSNLLSSGDQDCTIWCFWWIFVENHVHVNLLPPSEITLHSVFGQSQTF